MKNKVGLLILIIIINFPLLGQSGIIDSFRLSPNHPSITDDINFLVFYRIVPSSMVPETNIQFIHDSILIQSTINSALECCLENYIDTIKIGKLSQGEYTLVHEFNDIGKVLFLGTDTIISFTVSLMNLLSIDYLKPVKVYPNPARDIITISLQNTVIEDIDLKIFNLNGLEITSYKYSINNNNIIIELANYPTGLYLLKISDKQHHYYQKIVVESK